MSVDLVKQQIESFLKSDDPQVLAIKGRWGIGKTHTWNYCTREYKADIVLKKYSYVSLFGIASLDEIKRNIFENSIDVSIIGESNELESIKKNYIELGKKYGRKSSTLMRDLSSAAANFGLRGLGTSVEKVYDSIATSMLSNTLICFDDIERHSKSVPLRDFLGLVSYLKEQKRCKIVILLNEDSHDLVEYHQYKEKVIDKQLHYEPDAKHCFEIAVPQVEQVQYQHIKDVCLRLDIRNIRVLKRIQSHIDTALSGAGDYDEEIINEIVQTIIILSWCHYCHSSDIDNIPDLKFVGYLNNSNNNSEILDLDDENFKKALEKEKSYCSKWRDILQSYNYQSSSKLSPILLSSIEQGFVDINKLKAICGEKQKYLNMRKSEALYSKGWEVYHASFDTNETEVISAMEMGLRSAVKSLTASQYGDGIKVIRAIDKGHVADDLTQFFIDENKNDLERLNLKSWDTNPFGCKDKQFGIELQKYYDSQQFNDTPEDILTRRSDQNSYNQDEVKMLEKLTVKELKALFKSFKGEDLTNKIRACLMLGGSSEKLMENTKKALLEIGDESDLNKHRLAKFNIS